MERRKKPDFWILLSRTVAVASWVSLFVLQCIVWITRPEMSTGAIRYKHLPIREEWQTPTVEWIPILLVVCALLTLIEFIIRPFRARRRTDAGQFHLWTMFILIVATTALYFSQIYVR
ncbi:hypothetical protein [Gynuella sp.]|uniref:hypothetical protein n=1 Tax=Gynuella sp. TaxID=2969146 RepID=UPI003D0E7E06